MKNKKQESGVHKDSTKTLSNVFKWDVSGKDYVSFGGEYVPVDLGTAVEHEYEYDDTAGALADLRRRAERGTTYAKIISCIHEQLWRDRVRLEDAISQQERSQIMQEIFPNELAHLDGARAEATQLERFLFRLLEDNEFLEESYKAVSERPVKG